jgi:predicted nucleotidyltransferase
MNQYIIENILTYYPTTTQQIILFGSRARGDFKPYSDVDICVIFNKKTLNIKLVRKKLKPFFTSFFNIYKFKLNIYPLRYNRFIKIKKINSRLLELKRREGFLGRFGIKERERRIRLIKREGIVIFNQKELIKSKEMNK